MNLFSSIRAARFVLGTLALVAMAPTPLPAAEPGPYGPVRPAQHVILIDWDGFDPDYLGRVPMPHFESLARRGSLSLARGTYHTVSNPSRASTATGAYPEVHRNAAYYFDPVANRAVGQERFLAAQTIAQALAAAGKTIASVQWYMVQNYGTTFDDPAHLYVQPGGSLEGRTNVAIDILHRRPVNANGQLVTVPKIPDFLAIYDSDLDGLGHQEGAESPNIAPLLAEYDRQLGRLVQATKNLGIYHKTAFLLTSDHGMTTWNRTLIPQVLAAIAQAGFQPEVVTPGNAPAALTEVILVPNSVRTGDFTLRGRAATLQGRAQIRAALEQLPEIARVFDDDDLRALRAPDKLGDLVAEARPPWGFALGLPPEGFDRGSHGSTEEMTVPLLLSGAAFRRGVVPERAGLVDIAPTIAALLGVPPPANAQGRALVEVFSKGDLENMTTLLEQLAAADGRIDPRLAAFAQGKLQAAAATSNRGDLTTASRQLRALREVVHAQDGRMLPAEAAAELREALDTVLALWQIASTPNRSLPVRSAVLAGPSQPRAANAQAVLSTQHECDHP